MKVQSVRSKLFVMVLVGLLLIGSFIAYIGFQGGLSQRNTVLALPQSLSVSIAPSGPVQLTLNQTQVFVANVTNQDIPLSYAWSIENSSTGNFAVNGTNYLLLTHGNQAVFKFLEGNVDFCWLSVLVSSSISGGATVTIQYVSSQPVKVTDQQGGDGQDNQQAQTQNQNYFQSYYTNVYNNLVSTASYIVETDGKGGYQVINGTDGNIITDYTSTSANTTLNSAIASGGIIAIRSGNYSAAQLIVPANATIIAEPGVTGIKYASIADGARIDEPAFNSAFGGYSSGSYTIATNATSLATTDTWYLAFKPDNSIYWSSTNNSLIISNAVANRGLIIISGNMGTIANYIQIFDNTEIKGINNATITLAASNTFIFKGASPNNVQISNINFIALSSGRLAEPIGIDLSVLGGTGASNVVIRENGFYDFTSSYIGTPSAIRGTYNTATIENNIFYNQINTSYVSNYPSSGVSSYPIYLFQGNNVKIIHNNFTDQYDGNPIYMYQTKNSIVDSNNIDGVNASGSVIEGICITGTQNIQLINNDITNCGVAGILIHSSSVNGQSLNTKVQGGYITNSLWISGAGIKLNSDDNTSSQGTIINSVHINNTNVGIVSGELGKNENHSSIITSNWISNVYYPVVLYENHTTTLIGNIFENYTLPPVIQSGILIVANNIGFVTLNSGTVYLTDGVTSLVVNHGLAGTPTTIILTDAYNGGGTPAGLVWWDTENQTSFTIHTTNTSGNKYVSWLTIYQP